MRFVLALLIATFTIPGFAGYMTTPGEVQGPVPYSYTVLEDPDSTNTDVIYVLHGGGGSSSEARYYADKMEPEWVRLGISRPRIIAFSFGQLWLLVTKNTSPQSGLMEYTVNEVMPFLESKILFRKKVGDRFLVGHSMGGLNTLNLIGYAPTSFKKAVLLSPAILPLSPFATELEIKDFVQRTGAPESGAEQGYIGVREYLELMRRMTPTPEDWERIAPITTFKNVLAAQPSPEIYISGGKQDVMFYPGAEYAANTAKKIGVPIEWLSLDGDHGAEDLTSVADFLHR